MPVDPRITIGTLPNGLRYYLRANKQPQGRAELRLVVNAGSILEDDDQRGLAHFVEHMCFNGTRHFPKQDVVAFLQSTGMRFGAHINANTSFDQTVFQLQIPTDNPAVIDRSLLILEDWAHAVSFDSDEIDKERGVVLEEWRTGLGAGARLLDVELPVLLKDSRYAERLPIGKPEIIRSFPYERAEEVLYRLVSARPHGCDCGWGLRSGPHRGARSVAFRFDSRRSVASAAVNYDVPDHPGTRYVVATDPEATSTTVNVSSITAAPDQTTIGAYRAADSRAGVWRTAVGSVRRDGAKAGRAVSRCRHEPGALRQYCAGDDVECAGCRWRRGEGDRGAVHRSGSRRQFGFTQTELDRFRLSYQQAFAQLAASNDEHTSDSLADEYIRNFMQQEPIPGIAYENGLVQRFMPEITLADINSLARDWVPDRNRVVVVSAPQKTGVAVPDEAQARGRDQEHRWREPDGVRRRGEQPPAP